MAKRATPLTSAQVWRRMADMCNRPNSVMRRRDAGLCMALAVLQNRPDVTGRIAWRIARRIERAVRENAGWVNGYAWPTHAKGYRDRRAFCLARAAEAEQRARMRRRRRRA